MYMPENLRRSANDSGSWVMMNAAVLTRVYGKAAWERHNGRRRMGLKIGDKRDTVWF